MSPLRCYTCNGPLCAIQTCSLAALSTGSILCVLDFASWYLIWLIYFCRLWHSLWSMYGLAESTPSVISSTCHTGLDSHPVKRECQVNGMKCNFSRLCFYLHSYLTPEGSFQALETYFYMEESTFFFTFQVLSFHASVVSCWASLAMNLQTMH